MSVASETLLLELEGVDAYYGRAQILDGVSMNIRRGDRVAVLGRNGVGKTTLINSLLGIATVRAGDCRSIPSSTGLARREARKAESPCQAASVSGAHAT